MKYFAYGSILDPERMRESRITFSKRKRVILKDYRLELNKMGSANLKEGYANVMQFENGIVEGVLYDIGDRDLSKLDRYEGYPDHYGRSKASRPRGPGFASTPWKGLQTPLRGLTVLWGNGPPRDLHRRAWWLCSLTEEDAIELRSVKPNLGQGTME